MSYVILGASGFVGQHLLRELRFLGREVVGTSRRARSEDELVYADVLEPQSIAPLLSPGCTLYYLVHAMKSNDPNYDVIESESAKNIAQLARDHGVNRIIYLGGVAPLGPRSKHLASRLRTGEILRSTGVPVFELRAGMIVGAGSESFRIVRDLSARLPLMLLPKWLQTRSQPIAISDVVVALITASELSTTKAGVYNVEGPEILTAKEILVRVAHLMGRKPRTMDIPLMSPKLSSLWISFVTRVDRRMAQELVYGLSSDLLADQNSFWDLIPEHRLLPFDQAVRDGLVREQDTLNLRARVVETAMRRIDRRIRS